MSDGSLVFVDVTVEARTLVDAAERLLEMVDGEYDDQSEADRLARAVEAFRTRADVVDDTILFTHKPAAAVETGEPAGSPPAEPAAEAEDGSSGK